MTQWLSTKEAVGRYVHDGATIYLAGFSHLIPFAFGHEIIRQKRRELILCRATPDLLYDQMIAAGCAKKVVFSYAGNPGVGLLHAFRRAVEEGRLELEEYTHFELVARLEAGAAGLPFWPIKSLDQDLSRLRGRPVVKSPFGGEEIPVVAPLTPDVTLVHAHAADTDGNLYVWGIVGEMREAALAADKVLATVEEVLPVEELRPHQTELLLPAFRVDAISVEPWGAHPSYVLGKYDRDAHFYGEWDQLARDPDKLAQWLESYVMGVEDRQGYLRLFPQERLERLQEEANL